MHKLFGNKKPSGPSQETIKKFEGMGFNAEIILKAWEAAKKDENKMLDQLILLK